MKIRLCLIIVLILSVMMSTPTSPLAKVQTFKWRIQTCVTNTHPSYDVMKRWANNVEKMSGGRITFELFVVKALYPPTEAIDAVGKGVTEIGHIYSAAHANIIPEANIDYLIPYAFRNFEEPIQLQYDYGFLEFMRESFKPYNIYLLGTQMYDCVSLVSAKPLKSVKDFKGLKIRTHGTQAMYYGELGATSVKIPGGEIYQALSLGTVDAASWGGPRAQMGAAFYEVAKYYLYPGPFGPAPAVEILINMDAWNKLPDDLKEIFEISWREATFWSMRYFKKQNQEAMTELINKHNAIQVQFAEKDMEVMRKAAEPVWAKLAETSPRAKQAMKMVVRFLRDQGYTDFEIK